jgi:hypothetical protein
VPGHPHPVRHLRPPQQQRRREATGISAAAAAGSCTFLRLSSAVVCSAAFCGVLRRSAAFCGALLRLLRLLLLRLLLRSAAALL